jgi:hypothetical protein
VAAAIAASAIVMGLAAVEISRIAALAMRCSGELADPKVLQRVGARSVEVRIMYGVSRRSDNRANRDTASVE